MTTQVRDFKFAGAIVVVGNGGLTSNFFQQIMHGFLVDVHMSMRLSQLSKEVWLLHARNSSLYQSLAHLWHSLPSCTRSVNRECVMST